MLIAPKRGFVFLAMPKAASTSIETAFLPYSQIVVRGSPSLKHTTYAQFQHFLQPFLAAQGFPRKSYEVVCAFREPIDWLFSWWRYRSREELADPSRARHHNYTGRISFEQFAYAHIEGKEEFAKVGRQATFVQPHPGKREVDRVFRYERIDLLVEYLCERVGKEVKLGVSNVSPKRSFDLSEKCHRELREFLEPEYCIYEKAVGG